MRDQTFGWEMRTWARLQTQTGKSKVYLYYFSHVPPLPNAAWLGAQHGAEIPYAFNWPNGTHSTQVPWTETRQEAGRAGVVVLGELRDDRRSERQGSAALERLLGERRSRAWDLRTPRA